MPRTLQEPFGFPSADSRRFWLCHCLQLWKDLTSLCWMSLGGQQSTEQLQTCPCSAGLRAARGTGGTPLVHPGSVAGSLLFLVGLYQPKHPCVEERTMSSPQP